MAFALKKRRRVHGALLTSTLIVFLGPALFFSLIAFAPPFRIEGPETFYRFQTAGMTGLAIILLIALLFFARDWRNNWPYLLAAAGYPISDGAKALMGHLDLIDALTRTVARPSEAAGFVAALVIMLALLVRTVLPERPRKRSRKAVPPDADVAVPGPAISSTGLASPTAAE
jgi:hypothetical protein